MNIYFTAAIAGGRAQQPKYARIVRQLEKFGTVLSKHVSDERLTQYGETSMKSREILERELNALRASDIVVAEVTQPSLGVGYLLAEASALGKRVVALYRGKDALRLSGIIKGDASIEAHVYDSDKEIESILGSVFRDK